MDRPKRDAMEDTFGPASFEDICKKFEEDSYNHHVMQKLISAVAGAMLSVDKYKHIERDVMYRIIGIIEDAFECYPYRRNIPDWFLGPEKIMTTFFETIKEVMKYPESDPFYDSIITVEDEDLEDSLFIATMISSDDFGGLENGVKLASGFINTIVFLADLPLEDFRNYAVCVYYALLAKRAIDRERNAKEAEECDDDTPESDEDQTVDVLPDYSMLVNGFDDGFLSVLALENLLDTIHELMGDYFIDMKLSDVQLGNISDAECHLLNDIQDVKPSSGLSTGISKTFLDACNECCETRKYLEFETFIQYLTKGEQSELMNAVETMASYLGSMENGYAVAAAAIRVFDIYKDRPDHVILDSELSNYDKITSALKNVDAIDALKRLGSFIEACMIKREGTEDSRVKTEIVSKKYQLIYDAVIAGIEAHNPAQNAMTRKFFEVCKTFSESVQDVDPNFVDLDNDLSSDEYDTLHKFLYDLGKFVHSHSNAIDLGSAFVVTFNEFKGAEYRDLKSLVEHREAVQCDNTQPTTELP